MGLFNIVAVIQTGPGNKEKEKKKDCITLSSLGLALSQRFISASKNKAAVKIFMKMQIPPFSSRYCKAADLQHCGKRTVHVGCR